MKRKTTASLKLPVYIGFCARYIIPMKSIEHPTNSSLFDLPVGVIEKRGFSIVQIIRTKSIDDNRFHNFGPSINAPSFIFLS